ncbi:MAG: RNA polymerase sigma factor, partial [Bacteroidales bacterium]|nr:RNA polymerase sigma factor [Bacteroidales bacterium]
MDEKILLDKISQKDEKAFQFFVEKYHQLVLNVCNNILNNYDDAMDVSQEVFMKIYDSADQFRGESKITTWLYRISVNKSLNYLRSKKKEKWFTSLDLLFSSETKSIEPEDSELKPGESIEQEESKKALYYALRKLPEKQNIAISLNSFDDLAYKEISEIMNISVSEVGVLINRGKKKLHKLILDYY